MTTDTQAFLEKIAADLSREDLVFPTCFHITLKVRDLLRDPDVSIDKVAQALLAEPVISAKMIRLANSAAMMPSGGGEVRDMKAAITRVGLKTVKSVSFAVAMEQLVRSKHMAAYTDLTKQIWEHCILTAALCRQFAKQGKRVNADDAFFAGLVHDIGAFYLLFTASQDSELSQSPDAIMTLVEGWHDGIGYALLDALGQQPEELLMAVQDHESPAAVTQLTSLADILRAANRLANMYASWHEHDPSQASADLQLPMDQDTLQALVAQSQEDVREMHASLAI
jgi:HD-like signal output (HDOD) protein